MGARAIRSLSFGRRARAADRAAEVAGKGEVNDSIVGPGAWFLFGILLKFFLESCADKRKLVKEKRRMKRQGLADDNAGQKPCHLCNQGVDLLIRRQIDESKAWRMVCGKCWPSISGGVADGTLEFPHYRYGGLWKSR